MEPKDLAKVWDAPDNSRLTPKQMSIRLPIHVSASISALSEMYPRKTKTEIIGDLLATAIDQLVKSLPGASELDFPADYDKNPFTDFVDLHGRFNSIKQKYLKELEKEIAQNKDK